LVRWGNIGMGKVPNVYSKTFIINKS